MVRPVRLFIAFTAVLVLMALPAFAADDVIDPFGASAAEQTVDIDNSLYAAILDRYLVEGADGLNRFAYEAVTPADEADLDAYVDQLAAIDPTELTRNQQYAYWINMYNAVTLQVMIDAVPVDSIRDVSAADRVEGRSSGVSFFQRLKERAGGGPWTANLVLVNGVALSLNDIEHRILRPFGDARIHYGVNCASVGCPNLRPEPWVAATLDADFDAAARAYVNSPRGVHAGEDGGVVVSSIYNWFQEDWGDEGDVLDHLRVYAEGETAALLDGNTDISGYEYDWSLNDIELPARQAFSQ